MGVCDRKISRRSDSIYESFDAFWSSLKKLEIPHKLWGGSDGTSLPLLQRGQTYVVEVQMTSRPAHTVMLEVVCQDRFGKIVDRQVSTEGQVKLVYPEQAYSYQVRLLSAGMQEFTFHYFTISLISSEQ